MPSVLPVPEELIMHPLALQFPAILRMQASHGGLPVPPSREDFETCLKFCAQVYSATPVRSSVLKPAYNIKEEEATDKVKRAAMSFKDQVWAGARMYHKPSVPIPPILLLLKREHQLTKHVTNLHFVHGGVPLPISEDDFIKCLEFAVLIIKTYPARRSKDKSEARSERAAAEEFQKALYAATRNRAGTTSGLTSPSKDSVTTASHTLYDTCSTKDKW